MLPTKLEDLVRFERRSRLYQGSANMTHHCHAIGCEVRVPPEMLMCKRHWYMVPSDLRAKVWAAYRHGQCDDKNPSESWHKAADAAIIYVARKEGRRA